MIKAWSNGTTKSATKQHIDWVLEEYKKLVEEKIKKLKAALKTRE